MTHERLPHVIRRHCPRQQGPKRWFLAAEIVHDPLAFADPAHHAAPLESLEVSGGTGL
jgi:hypothetical protein